MEFIKTLHSYWAYLTIFMIALTFVKVTRLYFSKNRIFHFDRKIVLLALITTHIQFILGLILFFLSPVVSQGLNNMSHVMKNSSERFIIIEHPLTMILVIVLMTIIYKNIKKSAHKQKSIGIITFLFSIIAFIGVLSRIPWNTWLPI